MSLPPPEHDDHVDARFKRHNCYTAAQMHAYGQACREQALKEANKREPLSEAQLFTLWHALPDDDGAFPDFVDAARAIEQAHHITAKGSKP